jgi:hypothetical protein
MPATAATAALVEAAEAVLAGRWQVFGTAVSVAGEDPDWFADPATGRRAPAQGYGFRIPHRKEARVGNVKFVWELARLHHVTLLAAAWHCTGRSAFADRAIAHTRSWCRANPPLCGIHWVSGIELGLRLIAFAWTRRLLNGVAGIADAFEGDAGFRRQLHAHQAWLATFLSRGSSANNHAVAELAGLLVAALAFPIFRDSGSWAALAREGLERQAALQTFPDGINRELASDYHGFVLELLLVAGIEADHAGVPFSGQYWTRLRDMADALAAIVDAGLQPPRQGDGDGGRVLVLEPAEATPSVLGVCARIFGPPPWWPVLPAAGVTAALLGAVARPRPDLPGSRSGTRPPWFPDAGIAILRDREAEIWCRFDAGPHGFLSTAAHAHADALAFELRIRDQPILVDPGTYCYHGDPAWRRYFRATVAHNTLELAGRDQAAQGGPFLWLTQPATRLEEIVHGADGEIDAIAAWHDGYRLLPGAPLHHRRLALDHRTATLDVLDWIQATKPVVVQLAFTLHPDVACVLEDGSAMLAWNETGTQRTAELRLPAALSWSMHRGETDPILGWYSPHFARKVPTTLLLGRGRLAPEKTLRTEILLAPTRDQPTRSEPWSTSLSAPAAF